MKRILSFWLASMVLSFGAWSQNDKPSVKKSIEKRKDKLREQKSHTYESIRALAREVAKLDSSEIFVEADQCVKLFRKQGTAFFKVMEKAFYGHLHDQMGQHQQALEYLDQAIALAEKQKLRALTAEVCFESAYIRGRIQDERAIEMYFKAHDLFKSLNQKAKSAQALYQVAILQYNSEIPSSKKKEGFQNFLRIADMDSIFHRDIINARTALAMLDIGTKNYKSAEQELMAAMKISVAKKDSAWIGILSGNFSQLYQINKEYDKALKYLEIDKKLSIKSGERMSLAYVYSSFGEIYYEQKNTC